MYCPEDTGGSGSSPGTVFQVTNVAPSPLVVGTSGPMGIGGSGFSAFTGAPTVALSGSGVTVTNPTVANDGLINASYAVASNAPLGSQNLTVSFPGADGGAGVTSNPFAVTVAATAPVPACATIDSEPKQTYSNQTWTSCDGTTSQNNAYGYQRCVTYQIGDASCAPVHQNFTVQESISVVDPGNITSKMNTHNSVSNPAGQFLDGVALLGSSALPANACNIIKQTITTSGNSNPIRVNCIQFGATDATITDVTSNPAQCSNPTYHCN